MMRVEATRIGEQPDPCRADDLILESTYRVWVSEGDAVGAETNDRKNPWSVPSHLAAQDLGSAD